MKFTFFVLTVLALMVSGMNLGCLIIGWGLYDKFFYDLAIMVVLGFIGGIISMKCYENEAVMESKMLLEDIKIDFYTKRN